MLKLEWPQLWMDPGPLGTLGVGPGYAMAAKLARPDARVVLVYGDGSFGLHGLEFEAMARQKIPVVAVIGNDAGWTQIRRGQVEIYGEQRAVATGLDYTRYDKVVEACGGRGFWVERVEELGACARRGIRVRRPRVREREDREERLPEGCHQRLIAAHESRTSDRPRGFALQSGESGPLGMGRLRWYRRKSSSVHA